MRGEIHSPGKERLQNPIPWGKSSCAKKLYLPPPGQNKAEEINQRYVLKRHRNLLKMGISIKQNHLLKLKYSLHISETVFRTVVLISMDTCIAVVLQIYTLKLQDSYLKMAENVLSSSNYRAQAEWYWYKLNLSKAMDERTSLWNRVQKISHDMPNSVVNI